MIYFDRVNSMLKELIDEGKFKIIGYNHRFMEVVLKKYGKMNVKALFTFAREYLYENNEKIFLKEVKKLFKINCIADNG